MKTNAAHKAVLHAKPMRKSLRGKKHTRAGAHTSKKETLQPVLPRPEVVEATFEAPVEFVEVDLEPIVEVFEVYEVEGGDENAS